MHLSRMTLNPARRGARSLLSSPQSMHAAVLAGFPPSVVPVTSDGGRVLWRVDTAADRSVRLYIASIHSPDLTHLVEQAGWPTTATWDTRDYGVLLDRLDAGQRWIFRLTANPVHSARVNPDRDTQPVAHVTAEHQLGWLLERAAKLGVAFPEVADRAQVEVTGRRTLRFARRGATVTLGQATFDGVLDVVNPSLLRRALVSGVGRGKAYGCGLLTLAPPR